MQGLKAQNFARLTTLTIALSLFLPAVAQDQKLKMTTDIPRSVLVPDEVSTSVGPLRFKDGVPTRETVSALYDNLDRMRGIEVFLSLLPAVSMYGLRDGHVSMAGEGSNKVTIFENLMDSKALYLTANTSTLYAFGFTDLVEDGPTVIELPAGMLGALNDAFFRYAGDFGPAGQDKGEGGKYLVLPPGHTGAVPQGYFVLRPQTNRNWIFLRGSLKNGLDKAVKNITTNLKIYPLDKSGSPPATEFVNVSGKAYNTLPPTDVSFYEQLDAVIQAEPVSALGPELRGLVASIGIAKGQKFSPNKRMTRLLSEAAVIGNATARSIVWYPRLKSARIYPDSDSAWVMAYAGKDVFFEEAGARNLDARTMFFMNYTGVTPAMAVSKPGAGSDYGIVYLDEKKDPFDGAKTYKLKLPKDVPVKDFWAITIYDSQTRSQLQTNQQFPTVGSQTKGIKQNSDGSYDVYFGPKAPDGEESNWLQTVPGKGWFAILRMYGPKKAWISKTWRPGEIELIAR